MLKRILLSLTLVLSLAIVQPAWAQGSVSDTYTADDLVSTGGDPCSNWMHAARLPQCLEV